MFDDVLSANRRYASSFSLGDLTARGTRGLAVVTCMDVRIDPLAALGLKPGDANVLRNAGGRVTRDTLRSLVLATTFLGVTHVAVMHHTGCALGLRDEEGVRADLAPDQRANADGWEFLAMPDLDAALRADVEAVRGCKLVSGTPVVEGWRYDVETGLISRIVPADVTRFEPAAGAGA